MPQVHELLQGKHSSPVQSILSSSALSLPFSKTMAKRHKERLPGVLRYTIPHSKLLK
jgi:hypothetical protein